MPRLRQLLRPAERAARQAVAKFRRVSRHSLAAYYLNGEGIEIGALHNPLKLPWGVKVRYVDRMPVDELRRHYPELAKEDLVPVDIVDDGETLATIPDASQDFVIANHFLEHCENPLAALRHLLRTIRVGGALFMALPDKRYTFDADRPVTPFEHVLRDFREGPAWSRDGHFAEWVRLVERAPDEEVEQRAAARKEQGYSIHFHVWTAAEILELFQRINDVLPQKVEILCLFQGKGEVVVVARRA